MEVARSLRALWLKLCRCRQGNFALVTALLAPVLLTAVAGATDLFIMEKHRSDLQNTADAAVLAAAKEAGLKGWNAEAAKQVATAVIASNLSGQFSSATFAYNLAVDDKARKIALELTQDHFGYFMSVIIGSPQIVVRASARATGQATICIIVQSPNAKEAFSMSGASRVQASGCSAYSNSINANGMAIKDTSVLTSQLACTAGGFSGRSNNFSRLPLTDCPTLSDPLAVRAALIDSAVSGKACDFKATKLAKITKTLTPGTYCGGLEINDNSQVTLRPGVYVVKDGKLKVDKASTVKGDGVSFVFVGDGATLEFKNDSVISLSAPESGSLAGILMYAQAPSKKQRDFKIESKDAEKLIGTVYLPGDQLVIGGDKDDDGVCDPDVADDGTVTPAAPGEECISDVGAASSWTAIVANKLKVTAGSKLVLNSDYAASTVPVPDGLGPNSSKIMLTN